MSNVRQHESAVQCPSCKSSALVPGTLAFSGDDGWVTFFRPKGLRFFSVAKKTVTLVHGQAVTACSRCGHTWSSVDPEELRELLESSANTETLAKLKLHGEAEGSSKLAEE